MTNSVAHVSGLLCDGQSRPAATDRRRWDFHGLQLGQAGILGRLLGELAGRPPLQPATVTRATVSGRLPAEALGRKRRAWSMMWQAPAGRRLAVAAAGRERQYQPGDKGGGGDRHQAAPHGHQAVPGHRSIPWLC